MRDDVQVSDHPIDWPAAGVDDPDALWARIEPDLGRQRRRRLPAGVGRWLVPSGVAAGVTVAVLVVSIVVGGAEAVAVTRLVDDLDATSRSAVADQIVSDVEGAQIASLATKLASRLDDRDAFDDLDRSEVGRVVITLGDIGELFGDLPDFPELDRILADLEQARARFGGVFGGIGDAASTFRAGPAGTVTLEMSDGALTITSTEPSEGWSVTSSTADADRIEVVFTRDDGATVTLAADASGPGLSVSVTSDGMPLDLQLDRELPFLGGQNLGDLFEGLPSLEDLLGGLADPEAMPGPGELFSDLFPGFFEEFEGFEEGPFSGEWLPEIPRLEDFVTMDEFLADLQERFAEQLDGLPTYGILSDGGRSVHSVAGAGTVTLTYDGELAIVSADPAEGWTAQVVVGSGDAVEVVFRNGADEAVFRAETTSALVRVTVDRSGT